MRSKLSAAAACIHEEAAQVRHGERPSFFAAPPSPAVAALLESVMTTVARYMPPKVRYRGAWLYPRFRLGADVEIYIPSGGTMPLLMAPAVAPVHGGHQPPEVRPQTTDRLSGPLRAVWMPAPVVNTLCVAPPPRWNRDAIGRVEDAALLVFQGVRPSFFDVAPSEDVADALEACIVVATRRLPVRLVHAGDIYMARFWLAADIEIYTRPDAPMPLLSGPAVSPIYGGHRLSGASVQVETGAHAAWRSVCAGWGGQGQWKPPADAPVLPGRVPVGTLAAAAAVSSMATVKGELSR